MSTSAHNAELTPMDVLMLKGDADPRTRAIMIGVLSLDEVPSSARLYEVFERASRTVPRMQQRIIGPLLPGMAPEWCLDPEFDIDYHVRRIGVGDSGDLSAVLDLAAAMSTAPLDAARPLWDATLIDNVAGGGAALIFRAHHALTDGLGAVTVLAALLELEPGQDESPPPSTGSRPMRPPVDRARVGASRRVRAQHAWVKEVREAGDRSLTLMRGWTRLARDPSATVTSALRMGASLRRVVTRPVAEPSSLLRERSRRREFRTVEVSLDQLRAAGKSCGATVNDAYLAGLLGGFRRYHQALGTPVGDVPLAIPMSTRVDGNVAAGNHLSMARLSGPASIEDPTLRMVAVHEVVRAVRAESAAGIIDTLADVLQHVPSALAIRGLTAHARQVDLHASNMTGAPVRVYLAGSRVRAIFPFGPLTGVPVMAVLLSYDGKCGIGLTLDPAAVTDPDLFAACVRDEFAVIAGLTRTAAGRMRTAISGQDDSLEAHAAPGS